VTLVVCEAQCNFVGSSIITVIDSHKDSPSNINPQNKYNEADVEQ